jgi:hypothetical protein
VLATVSVLWRYVTRKMLDLDPWAPVPSRRPPMSPVRWQAMQRWLRQKLK